MSSLPAGKASVIWASPVCTAEPGPVLCSCDGPANSVGVTSFPLLDSSGEASVPEGTQAASRRAQTMAAAVSGQCVRTCSRMLSTWCAALSPSLNSCARDSLSAAATSGTSQDRTVSRTCRETRKAGEISPAFLGSSVKKRRISQFRFRRQPGKMAERHFSTRQSSKALKRLPVRASKRASRMAAKSVCRIWAAS